MEVVQQGDMPACQNMALDLALLNRAEEGEPGCRIYSWSEPWITLGRFQSRQHEILPTCTLGSTVRPTGGKAVLHGHDVTVGLALPLRFLSLSEERNPNQVYALVAEALAQSLSSCGLPSALGARTRFAGKGARVADCFGLVSPGDIVDPTTGAKRCGCALRLTRKAILLQASIPLGLPKVDPATVFAQPGPVLSQIWRSDDLAAALQSTLAQVLSVTI